ncbi:MAG TPA: MmgE/PrpD family protein [Methylomirabilota bacterium]|jgi:2-methylcitrate dehydratase PrpD|nr:MmgE/PrpD family protein [Methylomirabilota bacterium]
MSATSGLAEFVAKSRWEDCPAAAVEAARRAILDCLGVMLAGSAEPAARIIQTVADAEGGTPLCTVVGTGRRTGAVWAALCNGTAAHALDFDDTNFAMMGHPSAPVLSAALAAAELALADGRALVHAFLLGFEVETSLAEVLNPPHYERGWHATCTLGTLGAAAAAARLLGLDAIQVRTALAVAASQASGLKENFGTMTKPFHAGHAARSGVLAALLAREGWTASEQAIEGPQGFLRVLGAGKIELEALERLGAPWKILTSGVAVKPYPSCACTHSIIDGTLELRRAHGLRPEQVAEVTVGVNAIVPKILIHSDPRTGLQAKFSAEFAAAAALTEGRVGLTTFTDDTVQDARIRAMMKRVRMVVDSAIPGELERHMWTRVTIRLADGRVLSVGPREVPGHPSNPLPLQALREKFSECASVALPPDRVDSVREIVEGLDACPDLRSLTAILSAV